MVKEPAQVIDDSGPCDEDLSHIVIDDQVQVPLPEPGFLHQPISINYTLHQPISAAYIPHPRYHY